MPDGVLHVVVAFSPGPREVREWTVEVAEGATLIEALAASDLVNLMPGVELRGLPVGIWGDAAPVTQVLKDGDRIEVYRPLRVDPKIARRERFRRQGARATGLFRNRRPGSKPGY